MLSIIDAATNSLHRSVSSALSLSQSFSFFVFLLFLYKLRHELRTRNGRMTDDGYAPPPHHHRWLSVIHGCPLSVIRPFLLPLPVLGTVCLNMSRPHSLCLFSEDAWRLFSSDVPFHDSLPQLFKCLRSDCRHFGHVNRSFYLLTYFLTYLLTVRVYQCQSSGTRSTGGPSPRCIDCTEGDLIYQCLKVVLRYVLFVGSTYPADLLNVWFSTLLKISTPLNNCNRLTFLIETTRNVCRRFIVSCPRQVAAK